MLGETFVRLSVRILTCRPKGRNATKRIKDIFGTKVYDCFIFFNELEILEMRLHELSPYVDYFVIVEATKTFGGKEKTLYFKENENKFAEFKEKIIYIIVDDMPDIAENSRLPLQVYQRNQIKRGLSGCSANDIIMMSDVDEIPNSQKIEEMVFLLNTAAKALYYKQNFYYYYLNGRVINYIWHGTACCKAHTFLGDFHQNAHEMWRIFNGNDNYIAHGGWHFSYLGGVASIIRKISTISISEYDDDKYKNENILRRKIENGEDLFDRDLTIKYGQIDTDYPRHLLKRIDKYRHLIKDL